MFSLIIVGVLMLVAVFLFAAGPSLNLTRLTGVIPAFLALVVLSMSVFTIIEAKNAGVVTTMGKPTGSLEPGPHLKAPWQKVTELDGTKKTEKFAGEKCLEVRIGDGTMACATASVRWSIVGEKADEIYGDYRSDDVNQNVRDSLVVPIFTSAVTSVLGGYNPTDEIRVVDPTDVKASNASFVPDFDALAKDVSTSMRERVTAEGGYINVETITITGLKLSKTTQSKIDEFQAEVAKTQVALQAQKTAAAVSKANKELSASISNDPNVLVSKCLDTVNLVAEENLVGVLPAGFSCWNGGGSSVVIPSAPAAKPAE